MFDWIECLARRASNLISCTKVKHEPSKQILQFHRNNVLSEIWLTSFTLTNHYFCYNNWTWKKLNVSILFSFPPPCFPLLSFCYRSGSCESVFPALGRLNKRSEQTRESEDLRRPGREPEKTDSERVCGRERRERGDPGQSKMECEQLQKPSYKRYSLNSNGFWNRSHELVG